MKVLRAVDMGGWRGGSVIFFGANDKAHRSPTSCFTQVKAFDTAFKGLVLSHKVSHIPIPHRLGFVDFHLDIEVVYNEHKHHHQLVSTPNSYTSIAIALIDLHKPCHVWSDQTLRSVRGKQSSFHAPSNKLVAKFLFFFLCLSKDGEQ